MCYCSGGIDGEIDGEIGNQMNHRAQLLPLRELVVHTYSQTTCSSKRVHRDQEVIIAFQMPFNDLDSLMALKSHPC